VSRPHLTRESAATDFLESESIADGPSRRVPLAALWHVLVSGLAPIWPQDRTSFGGVPLGDVWPCEALLKAQAPSAAAAESLSPGDELVPFHKLTGWTTYSLIEPIEKILGWKFDGLEDMTGLPEYRNGACIACMKGSPRAAAALWSSLTHVFSFLFFSLRHFTLLGAWCGRTSKGGLLVDLGVISLKPLAIPASYYPSASSDIPRLPPSHPAIVEWRAMTVIEL